MLVKTGRRHVAKSTSTGVVSKSLRDLQFVQIILLFEPSKSLAKHWEVHIGASHYTLPTNWASAGSKCKTMS